MNLLQIVKTVQTVSKRPLFDAAPTGRRGVCIRSGVCCIAAAHVPIRTAEVLKLRVLVSLQSNSNSVVNLPNAGEKDVRDYFSVSSRGRLSFVFTKLTKQFKLYCQLTKRK